MIIKILQGDDMAQVLITGTNQGIGLELVKQYKQRGDDVIAACRTSSPELSETGAEVVEGIDVTDDASIAKLVEHIGDRKLDILINNAGILSSETLDDLDFDRMRLQYEVNTLGPLRVTAALAGCISDSGKVGIVTSRVGSMDDNGSGGNYGYRMSKAAANMVGVNLSHDFRPRNIGVVLLHPGYVRTNMTGGNGMTDAATAASGLISRMDELSMETTGTFWHAEGYQLPW